MRGDAYNSAIFDASGVDDTGSDSDAPVAVGDSRCVCRGMFPGVFDVEPVGNAPIVVAGVVPNVGNPEKLWSAPRLIGHGRVFKNRGLAPMGIAA